MTDPRAYEGYGVEDPLGTRLGSVEKVFVNGSGGPEYIRVRTGFLTSKAVLLPVQSVSVDRGRRTLALQ